MPLISIVLNTAADAAAKQQLARSVTEIFAAEVKVPAGHVHLYVSDNQFFSFGGDHEKPAAYVTVKSSAHQVQSKSRKVLVTKLMPLLQEACPGLIPDRISTMFEELPVEQIAVGSNIAVFGKDSPRDDVSR